MLEVDVNGEEPNINQGALDELNCHQSPRVNYKVKISICRRKRYQIIDLEDIHPDLINSNLQSHILRFVSQINIPHQRILVKL